MDFGKALEVLKLGGKVTRDGWDSKGAWLTLDNDRAVGELTLPFLVLNYPGVNVPSDVPDCAVTAASPYPDGARVPWAPSQTDMLADDWREHSNSRPVANGLLNDLLDAMELMAKQHCRMRFKGEREEFLVDSGGLSANADALGVLAEHGRFRIVRGVGSVVCGYWPENDPAKLSADSAT